MSDPADYTDSKVENRKDTMDYSQRGDICATQSMRDIKPLLPPYPGLGTLPNGFPGLNGVGGQLPETSASDAMFLSSFAAAQRGGMYDFHGSMSLTPPAKSPSPPPRVYKPCVVCSDKSSGYHYGVSSCEGCKGFFRRSVQKNISYTCQKDSNCEISKVTRNRCQHCRLKKCFEKGMSKEAVRNDRKKKPSVASGGGTGVASQINANSRPSEAVKALTDKDEQLIELILDAHRLTLPGGPSSQPLKLAPPVKMESGSLPSPATASPVPSTCSNMTGESSDSRPSPDTTTLDSLSLLSPETPGVPCSPSHRPGWDNVDELSSEGIVKVVEFAKKVPHFLDLSVSDQITLLKAACLEVLILRLSMRYQITSNTLTFSNGISVTQSEMERGGLGPLAHAIFKFSSDLQRMNLDEKELSLLSVVCLLASDRSGLERSSEVEKVQEPYLAALQHYIRQNRPNRPHIFAKLLIKLTDLRSISIKGADKVLHLGQESGDNIPPLVVEMFDRQENVCIV
ncbi:retinoic acid receptor alpha-A-like isoform X2 [Watersipora subatra]|uniref:retinoic acid receptor alpha-A-like isoform X2 n=1 Tax=Watersipora subatra TaxID=2589382 RepID=UPI00355C39C6